MMTSDKLTYKTVFIESYLYIFVILESYVINIGVWSECLTQN